MLKIELSNIEATVWGALFVAMMTALIIMITMFVTGMLNKNDAKVVDKVIDATVTFCEGKQKTHGVSFNLVSDMLNASCYRDR